MDELYLLVTISDRQFAKKFQTFYKEAGLFVSMTALGYGTAASEILDYFGLAGSEKSVMFHFLVGNRWREIKHQLQVKMRIDVPGIGIAFLIPISSIGGKHTLDYLISGQEFRKGEESSLKDTKYELVVAIANQGYTELIMDAARKVHASGGTVLHAKGTGNEHAEKFLGVTLVPEKEMVLLVVRKEKKNDIMKAIMEEAGITTKAKAVVFSVPVTDTAGMRLMEELEGEEIDESK